MTTDAPGVPGQTTGDVNNFVRPDEMGNVSPAVNARPLSNGYCLSQGITGDTSVRASAAIDEENAPCNLNSGDRIDSQDGSGNIESENNVNSCSANAQFENGNHIGSHPTDNASMIDAALELAPPTNIDKLLAPQTPSTFPTTPRFGQSSIGFPVANGYNVGANHPPPQPPSYEDSSTHFSQPSFPGMDMGTLFGRQHNFGYPPPPYYPSQPSVPTSGIAPPRTEITPQALLSLEDALDRTAVPTPPKRVRDEETSEQKEDGGDSSSSAGKKTGTKRRKNNRGAPKQLGTEGSARSVGNGRKIIPRRNMHSGSHVSAEERRRIRAERNRESAEKSRLRHKQRTEELERDVYHKRIENREVKASIDTYYAQLQGVADTIEKGTTQEEAMKKVPALYNALNSMRKAIEQCVWTYRDPREPEIPLKIPRN